MLDWLSSKVAVSLAVLLLLSSTAAYFATEDGRIRDRELSAIARMIAQFIGGVLTLQGKVELRISTAADSDLVLPKDVGGSPYRVQLRQDSVAINQETRRQISHWSGSMHLWQYDGSPIDTTTIERLDAAHQVVDSDPIRGFSITVAEADIGGSVLLLASARPAD